jgi:subtilisin family serine protease
MVSQFEHLELPIASIDLPRKPKTGGGNKTSRSDRSSHGSQLLDQLLGITESQESQQKKSPFHLNPKLIFKIQLEPKRNFPEKELTPMGLTLLSQEPKANKAIIVFASDDELKEFRSRLENYSGIRADYEYGYLDAIEELASLEPKDRIGRLLELEPLPQGEVTALDLELWHTGDKTEMNQFINDLDEVLRSLSEDSCMRISDRYVGDYLCLARIKINDEFLELLLEEAIVKEIDRRPRPSFEKPAEYNLSLSDLSESEIVSPSEENCGILVIDSGVQRGHPLIAPALGETEVFPDEKREFITGSSDDGDEKTGGHGTGVSGIAIYGDINQGIKSRLFEPKAWLFSARVTNQDNEYDPDLLLENQLEQAIDYFTRNYSNCKVINISLGDSRLVFREGQKQFLLAAKIDEIAYKLQHKNLVFVVSAGNLPYEQGTGEELRNDYPNYLLSEEARIIEPATSALALSIGSLSLGGGSLQYSEDAQRNTIAKVPGYPSPFTRSGFGVDGMIKPDLVDFGGDLVVDGKRVIEKEAGVGILTLAKDFSGSLFQVCCGTSFAAPRVANIAAQLFTQFPNATSNLIRALIISSATLPRELPSVLKCKKADTKQLTKQLQIYGYGQPNLGQAQYSAENHVVLLEDDMKIPVGNFQLFEIPPLPESYFKYNGTRILSITLAFDPPTRPTRGDSYLGVTMGFDIFKNVDKASLINTFKRAIKESSSQELTEMTLKKLKEQNKGNGIDIKLFPGSQLRNKGCVQRGQIEISSKARGFTDKPMYLVVSCFRKWAKPEEIEEQRCALVVSITHSNPEVKDLYNHIKQRTRIAQRTQRIRV